jgi:hypothetical protein
MPARRREFSRHFTPRRRIMSTIQKNGNAVGPLIVGAALTLVAVGFLGVAAEDRAGEAGATTALERKVDTLQANLKALTSKLQASTTRIAQLEKSRNDVLAGEVKVGDANKLDGLDSLQFVLASEGLAQRVELLEFTIDGLVSGEIPAGDSLKLDGAAAADYAKTSELGNYARQSDLLDYALSSDLADYARVTDIPPPLQAGSGLTRSGDTISVNFSALDSRYVSSSGGTVNGNLVVTGGLTPERFYPPRTDGGAGSLYVAGDYYIVFDRNGVNKYWRFD